MHKKEETVYSITELEELFQIPAHVIRYYEKSGLIPPIRKNNRGRRYYTQKDVYRIFVVLTIKSAEWDNDDCLKYLGLIDEGADGLYERLEMAEKYHQKVKRQMKELRIIDKGTRSTIKQLEHAIQLSKEDEYDGNYVIEIEKLFSHDPSTKSYFDIMKLRLRDKKNPAKVKKKKHSKALK